MDKASLRKKYLDIRKNVENKEEKSNRIFEKVIDTKEYKEAEVIALYKALETETNTDRLIEYSLNFGKVVCLPRVHDGTLFFYTVNSVCEDLEKSKFGVLEPNEDESKKVRSSLIDLVIVPGVAFDNSCNRIGFGKGYYDRFLQKSNLSTIGICFDEQIAQDIPVDKYDIKMDSVITEQRTIVKEINRDEFEKGM